MKKYVISFALLCAMNGNIISMQILTKLHHNTQYFSFPIKRSFNTTYKNDSTSESDSHIIFKIRQIAIEINKQESQLQMKNIKIPVLLDLNDEKAIKKAIESNSDITMQRESIQRNKVLLRLYLDALHKTKGTTSIE